MSFARLERLCAEMHDLAARIGASGPECNEVVVGSWLSLSPDGKEYILSHAERGNSAVVLQSPDKNEIMECYFVDLTATKAASQVADWYPPVGPWDFLLGWLLRPNSIKQQREWQIVQEGMLVKLDPVWSERAAIRNALRMREHVDIVFGVKGRARPTLPERDWRPT